ncbi:RNA polymerase sigma factor [Parapedobacter sp. 2B3]|uniref:RNA polymerase sigma factor n=1 Tax=Parapedobacter sp. 2B3 TaxID=3342381 RepID=UPI0035B5FD41
MKTLNATDEKALLQQLRDGDQTAFDVLYHRYKGLLYVHAYKRLNNREDVQDILHDIFSNLWESRKTLDIKENLGVYLYRAVRNAIINRQLKDKRATEYIRSFDGFLHDYLGNTDYLVRERMMMSLIETEINSLPPRMREVFELSRQDGLSHKEIAGQLNITEQSVRSHIKGALKILRLRLGTVILFALFSAV